MYKEKPRFVARITLVKGVPFYGFHVGYKYYLKIYMLNPKSMKRLADLLRQGAVMKSKFQPYEAHLPFILQWMTDYNLFGCGYVDCDQAFFRGPVPDFEDTSDTCHLWHDRSIPAKFQLREVELPRQSNCQLEVDIMVQDIQNRREIKPRLLHHDFIERLHPTPPDEKLVHSMRELWKDETRRRKAKMGNAPPGSSPFPPEVLVSMSADHRSSQRGGWMHEDEYEEQIRRTIQQERDASDGCKVTFENFVAKKACDNLVKQAFESVEDLHPENLKIEMFGLDPKKEDDFEVDETAIGEMQDTPEDDDGFPTEWDDDIMKEVEVSQQRRQDAQDMASTQVRVKREHSDGSNADVESKNREEMLKRSVSDPEEDRNGPHGPIGSTSSHARSGSSASSSRPPPPSLKRSMSHISAQTRYNKRQRIEASTPHGKETVKAPSQRERKDAEGLSVCERLGIRVKPRGRKSSSSNSNQPGPPPSSQGSAGSSSSQPRRKDLAARSQSGSDRSSKLDDQQLAFPVVHQVTFRSSLEGSSQKQQQQAFTPPAPSKLQTQWSSSRSSLEAPRATNEPLKPPSAAQSAILTRATQVFRSTFQIPGHKTILTFNRLPPKSSTVLATLRPGAIYQDPYYSNEADVPERTREYAGLEFKIEGAGLPYLPDFDPTGQSAASFGEKPPIIWDKRKDDLETQRRARRCNLRAWEIGATPPTFEEVEEWCKKPLRKISEGRSSSKSASKSLSPIAVTKRHFSQIEGPTQKNKYGMKYTQQPKQTNASHQAQYMSVMSLEAHVNTTGDLVPDPDKDEIQCVFWSLQTDDDTTEEGAEYLTGIIVLSEDRDISEQVRRMTRTVVDNCDTELDILNRLIEIVTEHDPDIMTGYEVHGHSWGYVIERARSKYEYNLCDEFSRMRANNHSKFAPKDDKWGFNHASSIRITGRHMFNIWRAMRGELNLTQYTFQNVVFHLLHKRVPHYSWKDLTTWYTSGKPHDLQKVLNYFLTQVRYDLDILSANELVSRTSEHARVLGIDFYSVYARGSQLKVESIMFRIAKPENFILVSPSRKQVGAQNALECLPLVMEPQSAFYTSPVLVMDFQSLYPSTMIAYNYCYSTFLGRIINWRGSCKMGFTEYRRQRRLLELLKDYINITPNGMMFVKAEIRKSLLAKMLGEILETRVMVKSGMKADPDNKTLRKLLNNRQLALKLTANVTYGYTSASFSGRMPCAEIADSIVQTGRETLEKAIALIHEVPRWGAEVVYGDTDSIFIHLKGKTREDAFRIGNEIAKRITTMNPRPMKLNFEKVYHPCVLMSKKRYVGFRYEKPSTTEPGFDAKGIETVRRDGTPAQQKIVEKTLKILFRSSDLSQVKAYFQSQCQKIMAGQVSIQDFLFAKEVKLGTYSDKGPPPPGAMIATKRMLEDERDEPQYGERVPYVVIAGGPNDRLIDRSVDPKVLLENQHKELDADYYINKTLIPPLERILNLVGVDVRTWYSSMPKTQRIRRIDITGEGEARDSKTLLKRTLESYMQSSSCLVCREKIEGQGPLCPTCLHNKPVSLFSIRSRLSIMEKNVIDIEKICRSCAGLSFSEEVKCDSYDCPVFYSRVRETGRLKGERGVVAPLMEILQKDGEVGRKLDW